MREQLSFWQLPFHDLHFSLHQGDCLLQLFDILHQFRCIRHNSWLDLLGGGIEFERYRCFNDIIPLDGVDEESDNAFFFDDEIVRILEEAESMEESGSELFES